MESSQEDMVQRKVNAERDQWLHLRVFYMRLSSCTLENTPQFLTMCYIPRDFTVGFEVNGERIAPSEIASSVLRRDRVDKQSAAVTYVNTDSVRLTGALTFEVYDKDVLLVCGKLQRLENTFDWRMDCSAGLVGCLFFEGGTTDRGSWSDSAPAMEVCVAGCCSGSPVIWTKKLQFDCERKSVRGLCPDTIPENGKNRKLSKNSEQSDRLFQLSDGSYTKDQDEMGGPSFNRIYPENGQLEEEDGELSWFNAGVGVGVGIGLVMFVGIGVGAGLLITTKPFCRENTGSLDREGLRHVVDEGPSTTTTSTENPWIVDISIGQKLVEVMNLHQSRKASRSSLSRWQPLWHVDKG